MRVLALTCLALLATPAALAVALAPRDQYCRGTLRHHRHWHAANITHFAVPTTPLACGGDYPSSSLIVSASNKLFDDGITCGQHIEFVAPNGHVIVAQVADRYDSDCGLKVSDAVFSHLYPGNKENSSADVYWRKTTKDVGPEAGIEPFYNSGKRPVFPPADTTAT